MRVFFALNLYLKLNLLNKFYKDNFYKSWQRCLFLCSDNVVNCCRLILTKLSVVLTASKLVIISYLNPDQAYLEACCSFYGFPVITCGCVRAFIPSCCVMRTYLLRKLARIHCCSLQSKLLSVEHLERRHALKIKFVVNF